MPLRGQDTRAGFTKVLSGCSQQPQASHTPVLLRQGALHPMQTVTGQVGLLEGLCASACSSTAAVAVLQEQTLCKLAGMQSVPLTTRHGRQTAH